MTDTIFLIADKSGIVDFKKTERGVENLKRGQVRCQLKVIIDDTHFRNPTITKEVVIEPWDRNLHIEDPHFDSMFITEEEAGILEEHRLEKMREIFESRGFKIEKIDEDHDITK